MSPARPKLCFPKSKSCNEQEGCMENVSSLQLTDEENKLADVLRALLISKKGKVSKEEMMNEYWQRNGERIPFRKLGFNTLECFLRKTKQFQIFNDVIGNTFIYTKLAEKPRHMGEVVGSHIPPPKDNKNRKIQAELKCESIPWTDLSFNATKPPPSKGELIKILNNHFEKCNEKKLAERRPLNVPSIQPMEGDISRFQLKISPNFKVQDVRVKGYEHRVIQKLIIQNPEKAGKSTQSSEKTWTLAQNSEREYQPKNIMESRETRKVNESKIVKINTIYGKWLQISEEGEDATRKVRHAEMQYRRSNKRNGRSGPKSMGILHHHMNLMCNSRKDNRF